MLKLKLVVIINILKVGVSIMKAKTFFTGAIVGVTAGIALAISMAPQPGQQLRSNISKNSTRYKNQLLDVKQEGSNVSQAISVFTKEAKNNIPQIINEVKETFTNFKKEIEPETKNLKQEIEGLQNSFNEIEQNISKHIKKAEQQASE